MPIFQTVFLFLALIFEALEYWVGIRIGKGNYGRAKKNKIKGKVI